MARPEKQGHDYFPVSTSREDRKPMKIMQSKFGNDGSMTVFELDCLIRGNRSNGYCLYGDEETICDLHEIVSLGSRTYDRKKLDEILTYAINTGYYDKKIYQKHKMFTNKEIQRDHIFTSKRRQGLRIKKEYMLLTEEDLEDLGVADNFVLENGYFRWVNVNNNSVNVDNNSINVNNNSINVDKKCTNKIKEKEIKEKESKLNEIKPNKISSKSNSEGNSNSESENSSLHLVVQQLISENFLNMKKDPLFIQELHNYCFELNQKYKYSGSEIIKAGSILVRSLIKKRDKPTEYDKPIGDICSWFKQGLWNMLNRKEVDYSMDDEELSDEADGIKNNDGYEIAYELGKSHAEEQELLNEADELEKLKAQRRKRKEGASNG